MNPIDPLLKQIAEILKRTEEELKDPSNKDLTPALEKQLKKLEGLIQAFIHVHRFLLEESGLNENQLKKIIGDIPQNMAAKDRIVLKRLSQLKESLIGSKEVFENEIAKRKRVGFTEEEKKQKEANRRKKKFRGMGESDSWKKL